MRDVERVDLTQVHGKTRHRRWHTRWQFGPYVTVVEVGQLPDGRWYAERHGRGASRWDRRDGACVYTGKAAKHYARATARRWMRTVGGTWVEA